MDVTNKNRGLDGDGDDDDRPARGYQQHDVDGPRSMEGEENTSTAVVVAHASVIHQELAESSAPRIIMNRSSSNSSSRDDDHRDDGTRVDNKRGRRDDAAARMDDAVGDEDDESVVGPEPMDDDDSDFDNDSDFFDEDEDFFMSPLVRAILDGEAVNVIQDILSTSPGQIQRQVYGKYPMSHAVSVGSPVDVVKALYNCWPESVAATDYHWLLWLPMHHVCAETPPEVVEFLVDVYPEALLRRDSNGALPIHTSIESGASVGAVRLMGDRCPVSLMLATNIWRLPIDLAVTSGDFDVVEYLADKCPQSLAARERVEGGVGALPRSYVDSMLPIHFAAETQGGEQQFAIVDFLATASPETVVVATAQGHLPVHLAIQTRSQPGVIQRLIVDAIPEATRLGLLHFALRAIKESNVPHTLLENVTAVAEAIPAALRFTDPQGSLPIHEAVQLDAPVFSSVNLDLAQRLVAQDPESLLIENSAGELPFHMCLHEETAQFLFASSPQSALVAGRDGSFPIHTAFANKWYDLVKSIVEHFPRETWRDETGGGFLHFLARMWYRDIEAALDVADVLVRTRPESPLERDADGNLPIHIAISWLVNDPPHRLVLFLIDRSPGSLQVAGAGGALPLHLAVAQRNPSPALVRLLVERWDGALVVRDDRGFVPLRVAHENVGESLDAIYVLVRMKPDVLRDCLSLSPSPPLGPREKMGTQTAPRGIYGYCYPLL